MALPFEDNTFDHVYVIEAACHAPDKVHLRERCYHYVNVLLRLYL
jgi:ubiquinone/menaquinone biosynthesis C-methylase UbiE